MTTASQIIINVPGVLYRVGQRLGGDGLWYDKNGNYTGKIHKLKEGKAGLLPMGAHPIFNSDNQQWVSTTDSIEMLRNWFSETDMVELLQQDYKVVKIHVNGYRRFDFDFGDVKYSHEVCSKEQVVGLNVIDPRILYPDLAKRL